MEMALVNIEAKSMEANNFGFTNSFLRAELMLVSGEMKEMTDLSGNTIFQIADDALVNKVELTIKK